MKMHYLKMLLFTFLINTLVLPHYENYLNNHYNVSLIQNKTKRATIKSRLLAQTQNHKPHYHNDPELKEIIDKMNEEAIKKYQKSHDPYEQLKDVVEKNGTKPVGGNDAEPMSAIEKELLETYEDMFGNESGMLKSGMYLNDDDVSDKSSSCGCTDINSAKLEKTKGKDKYLKHLKGRCVRGISFFSVGSLFLTFIGLAAARATAAAALNTTVQKVAYSTYASYITIFNMFDSPSMIAAIQAGVGATVEGLSDLLTPAAASASSIFTGCGIAALVLLILAVVLIILYIWLYRRRKRSWKHECKKHLCK